MRRRDEEEEAESSGKYEGSGKARKLSPAPRLA